MLTLVYALLVPVQEMIARSILSSLMLYLRGRFKTLFAILISSLLFSATHHLQTSFGLAVAAFPLGLFWGWLFWRKPTLIGVCLSHLALGGFALDLVGFPH